MTRQDSSSDPVRIPPLGELEQAQLYSCLDLIRDRMGDTISEQAAVDAILASNFDAEKALDKLLSASASVKSKTSAKEPPLTSTYPGMTFFALIIIASSFELTATLFCIVLCLLVVAILC